MISSLLLGVLLVVLVVLGCILFLPVHICLDTNIGQAWIRWTVANARLSWSNEEEPLFTFQLMSYKKSKNLRHMSLRRTSKSKEIKSQKKHKRAGLNRQQIIAIIRSFRVRMLNVKINTGDFVHNALLVPILQQLNRRSGNFAVSFREGSSVEFHATNSLWRLGRAYFMNR